MGKSSTVQGAEMFSWIIMMPQERWNMRSENGPCARVTWLWYSSIGLMDAAAELVVLGIGPEDRGEEDSGVNALGMSCLCHDSDFLWQPPGPRRFG